MLGFWSGNGSAKRSAPTSGPARQEVRQHVESCAKRTAKSRDVRARMHRAPRRPVRRLLVTTSLRGYCSGDQWHQCCCARVQAGWRVTAYPFTSSMLCGRRPGKGLCFEKRNLSSGLGFFICKVTQFPPNRPIMVLGASKFWTKMAQRESCRLGTFSLCQLGIFSFVPVVPIGIFSKNGVRSTGTKKQKKSNFQVGTFPCGMGLRSFFSSGTKSKWSV